MSYTPHVWECDEPITDEKLNNIEEGIQEALDNSGDYHSLVTTYEPHYKSFSGRNVDISTVHLLNPNYGWQPHPVIYDAEAYANPLSVDWIYSDDFYIDGELRNGKHNRTEAVEVVSYPSNEATLPYTDMTPYINDEFSTHALYIDVEVDGYIILPDDSLVKCVIL